MEHSGNKYHRIIQDINGRECKVFDNESGKQIPAVIDVYSVLEAFDVRTPAIQHCIKKLLCAGIRGKGSEYQDLKEARDAITRRLNALGVEP